MATQLLRKPLVLTAHSIKLLYSNQTNFVRNSTTATTDVNKFLNSYNSLLDNNLLRRDEHQIQSVAKLNEFYNKVLTYDISRNRATQPKLTTSSFFGGMFQTKSKSKPRLELREPTLKGVYLYGGVGCGKTMLMDMFYDHVPKEMPKLRIHFNKFMQDIHKRVHVIKNDRTLSASAEPFDVLAKQLCGEMHIIFFDEFQVTDIADAMLMSRLFTALFQNGIILFSTSNRVPSDLYMNGLQRDLFLPFIDILHHFCDVICLDSPNDYRKLSNQSKDRIYFHSGFENELLNNLVGDLIMRQDEKQSREYGLDPSSYLKWLKPVTVNILGREVLLEKTYKRLLDTTYTYMCDEYRSAADYLKLAELYDVIVVRNIPSDIRDANSLRRFIIFIDTLYDHKVKLVCSGQASCIQMLFNQNMSQLKSHHSPTYSISDNSGKRATSLFTLDEEIFALERTISRLIDMQSEDYIKMLRD